MNVCCWDFFTAFRGEGVVEGGTGELGKDGQTRS